MMQKRESISKNQQQLVNEFLNMTEASKKQATNYLARNKWNLQSAVNAFYDDGAVPEREEVQSNPQLDQMFIQYSGTLMLS